MRKRMSISNERHGLTSRFHFLVICSLVALLAACTVLVAQTTHNKPVVRAELRFDFGFMPDQSTVAHTFWLRNWESDSVKVEKIRLGCGCLNAPLPEQSAAPGDSLPVVLSFHSGHFRDHIEKRSRVNIRNLRTGEEQVTVLTITGFVAPEDKIKELVPVAFTPMRVTDDSLAVGHLVGLSEFKSPNYSGKSCDSRLVDQSPGVTAVSFRGDRTLPYYVGFSDPPIAPGQTGSITLHVDCDSSYNITIPIEVKN